MRTGKNNNIPETDHPNSTLTNPAATHRLAAEPVGKLLLEYSLPAIAGMLVMSLYNIVDRIFIGQGVGSDAISGLAITFPVMTISAACGMLIGAGSGARISIVMGEGDHAKTRTILGNALILTILIGIFYSITNLIWMDPILTAFGATPETLPYAKDYLMVIIPFTILSNLSFGFNNILRATGYPRKAMYTMFIGAIANLILDPIFIFWFDMGIRGAALATVISMGITAVWVLVHYSNPKHSVTFSREAFKLEKRAIIGILSIGMSPFLINLTASGVNVIFNRQIIQYGGSLAVGAYGIIVSYLMVIVMLILGVCQGMQPIVGYNYGAGHYHRVIGTFKRAVLVATLLSGSGWLFAMLFPELIARGFTNDPELVAIASKGLRYMTLAFPLAGFQIVTTNLFQSLGMAPKAIFLSLSRQVLFLIPALWILPLFLNLNGIWLASPVADTIATLVSSSFLFYQWRLLRKKLI